MSSDINANLDLFESNSRAFNQNQKQVPLAERMRPISIKEIVGQNKLLGENAAFNRLILQGDIPSMIFWGPPGTGKTTLALALANHSEAKFESVSAVMSGVKELRAVIERAKNRLYYNGKRTMLFVDEIHRFNKSQQDALLPHVESGLLLLIGATTENPSFEVNSALLSRMRVFTLESLSIDDLIVVANRALGDSEKGFGKEQFTIDDDAVKKLAAYADGDARILLGTLEIAVELMRNQKAQKIDADTVSQACGKKMLLYDKKGEEHYNIISAFIKSMRGSDAKAAVYWMVRMLEAGEDAKFIIRRMVIFASEDIGNADPHALTVANNTLRAFEFVGMPEGVLPLTQAAIYLANAPKSNFVLTSYSNAKKMIREYGDLPVPLKLRNSVSKTTSELGYGRGYKYPHNFSGNYIVGESYLPEELL